MATHMACSSRMCTESMPLATSGLTKGEIGPCDTERVALYKYEVRMGGAPSSME